MHKGLVDVGLAQQVGELAAVLNIVIVKIGQLFALGPLVFENGHLSDIGA